MSKCETRFDNATIGQVFTGDVAMVCPWRDPPAPDLQTMELERAALAERLRWADRWGRIQPVVACLMTLLFYRALSGYPIAGAAMSKQLAITLMYPITFGVCWYMTPAVLRENYLQARLVRRRCRGRLRELDLQISLCRSMHRGHPRHHR